MAQCWRGPTKRRGLYKTVRTIARKRVTVREAARHDARACANGRRDAPLRPDRALGPRVRAIGLAIPLWPGRPTCESPWPRASAPGAPHSDDWQNCQAAPPILQWSPRSGPPVPPDVRAISRLASQAMPPRSSSAPRSEHYAAGARVPGFAVRCPGGPPRHSGVSPPQAPPALQPRFRGPPAASCRVSGYRSASAAPHAPRTHSWQSRLRPARTSSGRVQSEALEPTARSAPRG